MLACLLINLTLTLSGQPATLTDHLATIAICDGPRAARVEAARQARYYLEWRK